MKTTFNVVCVTMRPINEDPGSRILWHQNITGEAILDSEENTVTFGGASFPINSQYPNRPGLDSSSLVIAINVSCPFFDLWELYTDTPADGSTATPEQIREEAWRAIERDR